MRTNTTLASEELETLSVSAHHILNIDSGKLIQGREA